MPESVKEVIEKSGLPAAALELEITENIALGHEEVTMAALHELRALGVGLAFDDFGTGYASLSCLTRYPLTRIKIDRSFVQKITRDSAAADTAIVSSIIAMTHNLGLEITAEGVETLDQANFLKFKKCDVVQGFLYAKPLPLNQFEEFLQNKAPLLSANVCSETAPHFPSIGRR